METPEKATPGNTARRTTVVNISGTDYTVKELLLDHYGEIEDFVKTKYVKLYRESAVGLDPDEIHKRVMEILKSDVGIEELKEQMKSAPVQLFTAYIAIRDNPGITLEICKDLLDSEAVDRISEAVNALGDDGDENPPQGDQEISSDGGT